jgi:ribosomal protein S4
MSKIKTNKYIAHKSRYKLVKSFFEDNLGLFLNKKNKIGNRKLLKWSKASTFVSLRESYARLLPLNLVKSTFKKDFESNFSSVLYGLRKNNQFLNVLKLITRRQLTLLNLFYPFLKVENRDTFLLQNSFFFLRKSFLLKNLFFLIFKFFGEIGLTLSLKNPKIYVKVHNLLLVENLKKLNISYSQVFNQLAFKLRNNYLAVQSSKRLLTLEESQIFEKGNMPILKAEANFVSTFNDSFQYFSFFNKKRKGSRRVIKRTFLSFLLKKIRSSCQENSFIFIDFALKALKLARLTRQKPFRNSFISLKNSSYFTSKKSRRHRYASLYSEFNILPILFFLSSPVNSLLFFKKYKFKFFKKLFKPKFRYKIKLKKKNLTAPRKAFEIRQKKRLAKKKLQKLGTLIVGVKKTQKNVMDKYNPYGRKLHLFRKLRFFFGFMKKRHLLKYKKVAKTLSGKANLNFLLQIESRIDVILFRLGIFNSFGEIHSFILNGKIFINNKKITTVSHQLKDFDSFFIQEKEQMLFNTLKRAEFGLLSVHQIPEYIEFDFLTMTGIFLKNQISESNIYLPLSDFGHTYVTNKNLLIALD